MRIYEQELKDGLEKAMSSSLTISSLVVPYTPTTTELAQAEILNKCFAENKNQPDLYYMSDVLVSTGWNKNDDVFDPVQTFAARHSPEDKQFNFMHDETDIIGHITGNYVTDFEGNRIECNEAPENFNIVTTSVLYTAWSKPMLKERIKKIIEEIPKGKWFVSMECYFNDFDYALIAQDGSNKVLARDEKSSFLTKHLRAYGGKGEYSGYRIGRVLKNLTFSGKGLVDNPANPKSLILASENTKFAKAETITVDFIKGDKMDELEKVKAEVTKLTEDLNKAKAEVSASLSKVNDADAKLKVAEIGLRDKEAVLEATKAKLNEVEVSNKKLVEDNKGLNEKVAASEAASAKMVKEALVAKRVSAFVSAGLSEDVAKASVAKLEGISDEAFEQVVALTKPAAPVKLVKEKDEKVLETAEPEKGTALNVNTDEDKPNELRAKVSSWFEKDVLKSTANLKGE